MRLLRIGVFATLLSCVCGSFASESSVPRFVIEQPAPGMLEEVTIDDPDLKIASLGGVQIIIDFGAEMDDLMNLSIRRAELTLADGRKISQFALDEAEGDYVGRGETFYQPS